MEIKEFIQNFADQLDDTDDIFLLKSYIIGKDMLTKKFDIEL